MMDEDKVRTPIADVGKRFREGVDGDAESFGDVGDFRSDEEDPWSFF